MHECALQQDDDDDGGDHDVEICGGGRVVRLSTANVSLCKEANIMACSGAKSQSSLYVFALCKALAMSRIVAVVLLRVYSL